MRLEPLQDRVLVLRVAEDELSPGGIVIPDAAKEKPQEGLVVAAGPGRLIDGAFHTLSVVEGDKILFSKYAGTDVNVGGGDHIILREDDILAIVREDEDNG